MKFPDIEAFPTFWENGMKLSASHFRHLEDSIEDAVRDAQATAILVGGSFGLLPYSPLGIINAQGSIPNSVKISLNACRAILPGGYRVEILPKNIVDQKIPNSAPFVEFVPNASMRYHIFLTVMEKRIPAGIPQVRPIRQPYLSYDYLLEAVSQDRIRAIREQGLKANRMKIAEWQNGKIIGGYIPPTITTQGFTLLEKWHNFFQTQLENVVRIGTYVVHDNKNRAQAKVDFCIPIITHIKSRQGYFRLTLPDKSPVQILAFFADLAGLLEGLLDTCDRDFVRTQLRNGEVHNLRPCIQNILKPIVGNPQEEIAVYLTRIQELIKALQATLQSLLDPKAQKVVSGDRN